ncbi:hypothetical protein U4I67_03260 [Stenotrophomonas maltophilia]|uniref:hypothetical protein n=1 Tax=Stenotrophomonas maltophilia TaxID=40324 RepID=UPI002ACCA385|nr:hypothetical protein [Stenotrophomonas maltophilia]MDZ5777947.1 hypothetical protein [Stenotrophomonas maltophilia]
MSIMEARHHALLLEAFVTRSTALDRFLNMTKKRNKRRRKKGRPVTKPRPVGFGLLEHPFNRVDREALRAAFHERSQGLREELPAVLARLVGYFRDHDPATILSIIAFYGSFQAVTSEGPAGENFLPTLEQHHLEVLQALALSIPAAEAGHLPPPPGLVQNIIDDAELLSQAFAWSRLLVAPDTATQEELALVALQERLRLHTQIVRNWGYVHQVRQVSSELYGSIDPEFEKAAGFTTKDVIEVIYRMVKLYEERASHRMQLLGRFLTEPTPERMVQAYYATFPHMIGKPEDLLRDIGHLPKENVTALLLSHSELSLPQLARFDASTLSQQSGVPETRVELILNNLCMEAGDLSKRDPMHFFMDNPVWNRPGMRHGAEYVFPTPQSGLSHVHRIMRRLIETYGVKATYELRRAKYLEDKVGELLRRAFPTGTILPSVSWSLGDSRYETDHIVVLDRVLMIVEAKSAALTPEALRGAPMRVKRHLTDLVFDPAQQSQRLEQVIRLSRGGDPASHRITDEIGIDVSLVDTIIRLSVTLDDFSMISMAEDELRAVGWAPDDLVLPATLNIADFETVLEILERPALILHYFAERPRFQRSVNLLADEIDLLGVYLSSLFHFPEINTEKIQLLASGESKPIDTYFNRLEIGLSATKPSVAVAPAFLAILDRLADRQVSGWITISLDLLSTGDLRQQTAFRKGVEALRRKVPNTEGDPHHLCAIIAEPANSDAVIAVYVFTSARAAQRRETIEQLAAELLERSGRQRLTVIGKQVEFWDEPYRIAAVAYTRADDSQGEPTADG